MKYKNLTKEQLLLSFDRLTRFKSTRDKYLRVFTDIILANLIEPSFKKAELLSLPASKITRMAEEVINKSLSELSNLPVQSVKIGEINNIIEDYENSVFKNDNDTIEFLNNNINYPLFIPLIDESCPINLRWLKMISVKGGDLKILRHENGLKFPIEKVLLVEGLTEEILLPAFSKYCGFDFYKEGIQIIPAGGKNQVVKSYYRMIEELKLPIFLLLDKDAEENIKQIKPKLRNIDKIHLVSCGEFEDLLPESLIIKTFNNEFNNFSAISEQDLDKNLSAVKNLENLFKTKGLHEFKKAEFAKMVRDNISQDSDISSEIKDIIREIGA